MELVRLRRQLEKWCRRRVADPHNGDLDTEEPRILASELVQEREGLAMFLPKLGRHPDHRSSIEVGGVGDELAEVIVISRR